MARILIIDDDTLIQKSLSRLFQDQGHDVQPASTLAEGLAIAADSVDIVYLDLGLPDGDGLQAISKLADTKGQPEVIVITGIGSDYAASRSIESRAWDYLAKPASPAAVLATLNSALSYRQNAKKEHLSQQEFDHCGIIGDSAALRRMLQDITRAAASEASVLVQGETGVGKELTARALHRNSPRKEGPFVVVDCSNLSDTLVESTLYGHVKGAFTGAHHESGGLVAQADGGTLFLDEIGELPLEQQKSFLRVLQERTYRPVGATRERTSDFRLVCATNRDLAAMAGDGRFRNDLLFRIRTVEIAVPSLRERGHDIELLARHFVTRTCDRYGLDNKDLSSELQNVINSYTWPGNIRELMNIMEASVIQSQMDAIIYPKHLPVQIRMAFLGKSHPAGTAPAPPPASSAETAGPSREPAAPRTYEEHKKARDRAYFRELMAETGGDITRISTISGLSVPSVYRHLALANIPTRTKQGR